LPVQCPMLTVSVSDKGQGGQTHGITSREPIDLATGAYLYDPSLRCIGTFEHGTPVLTVFPS